MFSISFPPIESEVIEFAHKWTDKLVAQDYEVAHEMLRYVAKHPGGSWVHSPNELRDWISNYGSDTPIDDEPTYAVTSISTAAGNRWDNNLELKSTNERYSGYVGRLDWWLPLNGEWSDLQASFDLVKVDDRVAFVLVALRVP
ncbi:hypothetical protein LPN04_07395 [Rugamonas sp. A1-17]|nr:hypothetical protein [Rugamonas sp. A1-17]